MQACIDANDLEALKARVAELEFVNATATHGRELFPGLALGRRHGGVAARPSAKAGPVMSADASSFDLKGKVGVKTLEMLALNDDLNTVVSSNSYCTRRQAMARAAGLASGLSMASVSAPPPPRLAPPRLPSPPRPPSRPVPPPRPSLTRPPLLLLAGCGARLRRGDQDGQDGHGRWPARLRPR